MKPTRTPPVVPAGRTPGGTARTTAAILVTAALAMLTAACGGSPGSHVAQVGSTAGQSNSSSTPPAAPAQLSGALAFSRCMRSHAVPNWPDPNSSGKFPKRTPEQLGVSSSQFRAAQSACQRLLPAVSTAQQRHDAAQALRFSECMRNHGVTNFPDPDSTGRIPDSFGIDQGSPRFEAANDACRNYRPPYIPSNAAYNAWARTNGS